MNALFWDLPAQLILSLPSIIWIWYRFQTHFVIDENHFHFLSSHLQTDLEIEKEWVRGHCASSEERSTHPVVREVVRLPPERQSKKVKMKTDKFNLRSERGLVSLSNPSFCNPLKWKRHGTIFIFSAFFQNMMFPVWFVLIWSYLCVKMWTNSFPPGRSHLDIWAGKRIIDRHILKYSACCTRQVDTFLWSFP